MDIVAVVAVWKDSTNSEGKKEGILSNEPLTDRLAKHILNWRVAPGRYLTGERSWIPRWRFEPTKNLEDAFRLIDAAKAESYTMHGMQGGLLSVKVTIRGKAGEAVAASRPMAITTALARALGMEV